MEPASNHAAALSRWRIPRTEIAAELEGGKPPLEMICLGCAAKVPLVSVVYPVLEELKDFLEKETEITLQPRDDVYAFETDGEIEVERGVYRLEDLAAGLASSVTETVRRFRPDGIVLLANYAPNPSAEKLRATLTGFYRAAAAARRPFTVGKGHTIQLARGPGEEYLVVDYIRTSGRGLYGVANNDTISRIDPNLLHSSWISVFVGLNNALNDLFLSGVHRGLRILPTVDARDPAQLPRLAESLRRFPRAFPEMGAALEEQPPLGFGTNSNGATVIGVTDREIPANQGVVPGQTLIATRPIGDLAPLTEVLIQQGLDEPTDHLEDLRRRVIDEMLVPNFEAARIIHRRLPGKGQRFDARLHVTAARDMTGPGILVLEELAQDSGVDIYLDRLELHDELVANVMMDNPTSGTNGAIVIAAMPAVASEVLGDLRAAGYSPWVVGKALGRSDRPAVHINRDLSRYGFLSGVSRPLFERFRFVDAVEAGLPAAAARGGPP